MLLLDVRWVLSGLLLLLLAAALVPLWLEGRLAARRAASAAAPPLARFDHAPLGLLLLRDSNIRYANAYARRLLDLAARATALPEADWASALREDCAAARREGAAAGRYRRARLDGDRYARWWIAPEEDLDLVLLFDETTPYRTEQAARFLISDLSHELRTPLATLLTHLQILQLPNIREEVRRQSLQLLGQETKRMARLVHDLLELGRLETSTAFEPRPLNLQAVAEAALAQVDPDAQARGVTLALRADAPLPPVAGDEDALKRVFLNLLDNACKYSRPGDRVMVSLQRSATAAEVCGAVCDTGPGIPAEHLPHVTRRFYRAAPEEVAGSGLGLALVEEILIRHGSRLELESHTAPGPDGTTGTCARFRLPVVPA